MRRQGFTLIETVIALGLVLVVLGSTMAANRVITNNATLTEERTQMSALAEEAAGQIYLLQRELRASSLSLGDATRGFNLPAGSAADTTRLVMPYAATMAEYTPAATITPLWCTNASVGCGTQTSSVRFASTTITIAQQFANSSLQGELLAVRRKAGTDRQMISMTSRLAADGTGVVDTSSTTDAQTWDFYVRKISVTRLGTTGTWHSGPLLNAGSNAISRNATFAVTITVKRYNQPTAQPLVQNLMLTDY